jgi:transcription initiation factor TFIIIB Brf1 subunit/transcription initiation factor TFIIB
MENEDFLLLESLIKGEGDTISVTCKHAVRTLERGMYICQECGAAERVQDGQTFTAHKMYKRPTRNTSITSNLEQKGFDSRIIVISNKIYNMVVDEQTKRTGNRNSIICACVFQAFKIFGHPVDYSHIYEKYGIKKRSALKGLKIVNAEIAKKKELDFHMIVSSPIVPEDFIVSYMEELKAPEESIKEVLCIYEMSQDQKELGMSRPQSIAAGVIHYWLRQRGKLDAIQTIVEKSNLSLVTIAKKSRLVAERVEQVKNDAPATTAFVGKTHGSQKVRGCIDD